MKSMSPTFPAGLRRSICEGEQLRRATVKGNFVRCAERRCDGVDIASFYCTEPDTMVCGSDGISTCVLLCCINVVDGVGEMRIRKLWKTTLLRWEDVQGEGMTRGTSERDVGRWEGYTCGGKCVVQHVRQRHFDVRVPVFSRENAEMEPKGRKVEPTRMEKK